MSLGRPEKNVPKHVCNLWQVVDSENLVHMYLIRSGNEIAIRSIESNCSWMSFFSNKS